MGHQQQASESFMVRKPSSSLYCPRYPSTMSSLDQRSEEHTSELQSRLHLVCRLLLEKKQHESRKANAQLLKVQYEDPALWELARRSRGTPRIANRLLRRVRALPGGLAHGQPVPAATN